MHRREAVRMMRCVFTGLAAALIVCGSADGAIPSVPTEPVRERVAGFSKLRLLDEAHATDFRRAFDDAKDLPRYIVALSPT